MKLLVQTIRREIDDLMENNVRLSVIGRLEELPEGPREEMAEGIRRTAGNAGLNLVLALNYGGRTEIIDAVNRICEDLLSEKGARLDVTEALFRKYLYTAAIPDPDIIIRTSGELRISNFLLWQMAYAEIYVTPVFWPEFRKMKLYEAISDFQNRERRFGKVSEQVRGLTQ